MPLAFAPTISRKIRRKCRANDGIESKFLFPKWIIFIISLRFWSNKSIYLKTVHISAKIKTLKGKRRCAIFMNKMLQTVCYFKLFMADRLTKGIFPCAYFFSFFVFTYWSLAFYIYIRVILFHSTAGYILWCGILAFTVLIAALFIHSG